jgi:hypothetical protein
MGSGIFSTIHSAITLEVIESSIFDAGETVQLTSSGIAPSHSAAAQALASHCTATETETGVTMEFRLPEEDVGEQHFAIIYEKAGSHFTLTDLGKGTGTFVKIIEPLRLKARYIVSFGDSHMAINVRAAEERQVLNRPTLKMLFVDGPKLDQAFTFEPEEREIKIGRMIDCQIRFSETSLSRYQSVIKFVEGRGWMLSDGDGNKSSTNGTWLFVEERIKIRTGLVFKAGSTLFKIKE